MEIDLITERLEFVQVYDVKFSPLIQSLRNIFLFHFSEIDYKHLTNSPK